MKYVFSIALLLLIILPGYSQQYHPFPTDSAVWRMLERDDFGLPLYTFQTNMFGDTIIYNRTYYKIGRGPLYQAAIREDSMKRIYVIPKDSTHEFLLYDFSVNTGDTIKSIWVGAPDVTDTVVITQIDSVMDVNNEYRRRIQVTRNQGISTTWIEGVGTNEGVWPIYWWPTVSGYPCLINLSINDTLVYQNEYCLDIGIKENPYLNTITLSPNPFSTSTQLQGWQGQQLNLTLYDISGKVVRQMVSISNTYTIERGQLTPGLYLLQVADNERILEITKLIVE